MDAPIRVKNPRRSFLNGAERRSPDPQALRRARIDRIRALIARGEYPAPDKIEIVVNLMLAEWCPVSGRDSDVAAPASRRARLGPQLRVVGLDASTRGAFGARRFDNVDRRHRRHRRHRSKAIYCSKSSILLTVG
jgi:hypothetical protein